MLNFNFGLQWTQRLKINIFIFFWVKKIFQKNTDFRLWHIHASTHCTIFFPFLPTMQYLATLHSIFVRHKMPWVQRYIKEKRDTPFSSAVLLMMAEKVPMFLSTFFSNIYCQKFCWRLLPRRSPYLKRFSLADSDLKKVG